MCVFAHVYVCVCVCAYRDSGLFYPGKKKTIVHFSEKEHVIYVLLYAICNLHIFIVSIIIRICHALTGVLSAVCYSLTVNAVFWSRAAWIHATCWL